MLAKRQTDRQTDVVITILRHTETNHNIVTWAVEQ